MRIFKIFSLLGQIHLSLSQRYALTIRNNIAPAVILWIFVVIAALFFAYAFYCASKGYNFSGMAIFQYGGVSIGCTR